MPAKQGRRKATVEVEIEEEVVNSQESLTEGLSGMRLRPLSPKVSIVEDLSSPRPITRSMTPQVAVVPEVGVLVRTPTPPDLLKNLQVHGVICREEGEYFAPQKFLYVSCGSKRQLLNIKHRMDNDIEHAMKIYPDTEFYRFNIKDNFPLSVTKVSQIDRGYSGKKYFEKPATEKKRRRS